MVNTINYSTKVVLYYHSLQELIWAIENYLKKRSLHSQLSDHRPVDKEAFKKVKEELLTAKYLEKDRAKEAYKIFLERSAEVKINEEFGLEHFDSIILFFNNPNRQKFFSNFILQRKEEYENQLPIDAIALDAIETAFREDRRMVECDE